MERKRLMASFRERLSAVLGVETALPSACGRFWVRSSVGELRWAEVLMHRRLASGLPISGAELRVEKARGRAISGSWLRVGTAPIKFQRKLSDV